MGVFLGINQESLVKWPFLHGMPSLKHQRRRDKDTHVSDRFGGIFRLVPILWIAMRSGPNASTFLIIMSELCVSSYLDALGTTRVPIVTVRNCYVKHH